MALDVWGNKFIKNRIIIFSMVKRITIAHEDELRKFEELLREKNGISKFTNYVFYLDACVFDEANFKHLNELLATGNFRISHVALKELEDWKKPPLFSQKLKTWQKTQDYVKRIKKDWKQNIEQVSPGILNNELNMLEPLLPKTLAFNLIAENKAKFDEIYKIIQTHGIDIKKFSMLMAKKYEPLIRKNFKKYLADRKSKFTLENSDKHEDRIIRDIEISVRAMVTSLLGMIEQEGLGPQRTFDEFTRRFRNEIGNDVLIVEHYLLSPLGNKHFPTYDKDTRELLLLHRDMVLAPAA